MNLRVTPNTLISRAIQAARSHTSRLADLQQQASSGLKVTKPSDDPAAMKAILLAKSRDARLETELANIRHSTTALNSSVTQLLEANNVFVRAKQIAIEGALATDPSDRDVLAKEVEQLIEKLLTIGNATQHDGDYMFGGTNSSTPPFSIEGRIATSTRPTIQYHGSNERSSTNVGLENSIDVLYSGSEIFLSRLRSDTVFLGDTGAISGTGTDSGIGHATLEVIHESTTYAPGSGVQAGVSSQAGDTILGPSGTHVLTIVDTSGNGTAGTVSLNGGEPVAFTNADTDLAVLGGNGGLVYVDTTSITPAFSGDVAITANGALTIDGNATTTPIDFSTNQLVQNSLTGEVTNVDSSNIRRAGTEHVEYTGTSDAFTALFELRDDLLDTRNLSSSELVDSFDRRTVDLDRVRENILSVVGHQSIALEHLQNLEQRVQDIQLETRQLISEYESADISEVAIKLTSEQTLLQFTYASATIVLDQSLLDFLR